MNNKVQFLLVDLRYVSHIHYFRINWMDHGISYYYHYHCRRRGIHHKVGKIHIPSSNIFLF